VGVNRGKALKDLYPGNSLGKELYPLLNEIKIQIKGPVAKLLP
jgi:hypothetical protein